MKKYYQLLGVRTGASQKEIYQAYRALAKEYHPDSNKPQASAERFRKIRRAYDALKDEDARSRFEAQERTLSQIEKFHALAKAREAEMRQVANGGAVRSAASRVRKGPAKVFAFPQKKKVQKESKQSGVMQFFEKIYRTVTDVTSHISDLQHRQLTRKLNRIPESEIGVRS